MEGSIGGVAHQKTNLWLMEAELIWRWEEEVVSQVRS